MMKNILRFCLFIALALPSLLSCSNKAKYITEDTPLDFKLVEKGATFLTVSVVPQDDRVYYVFNLIEKEEYDSLGRYEQELMNYVLDTLYKEYNEYRSMVDPDRKETYFCSFADYALNYATGQRRFTSLFPGEKYVAVAFCVNPDNNTPLGRIYAAEFSTIDWSDIKESTMDFEFRVWDVDDEDNQETRLYCKPVDSKHSAISKDYYILGDVVMLDTLRQGYGGDLMRYAGEYIGTYSEMNLMDIIIKKDIFEYAYLHEYFGFKEGKEYVFWAMPYSLDCLGKIRYHKFTFNKEYKENGYTPGTLYTGEPL